jgi:hypothetical protein
MQLSERIKATASEVIRRAKLLLTPFDLDQFARHLLAKDISLLRHRYRGQIPKSITATDVAAYLELHDASSHIVSEHCVTEGFHILRGPDFLQVVKTEHGRRQNIANVKHIHAALIIYCEHLLADLRQVSSPVRAMATSSLPISAKTRLVTIQGGSQASRPAMQKSTQRVKGQSKNAPRPHLHLVH